MGDGTSLDFVKLGVGGGEGMKGFLNAFSREKRYTYILIGDLWIAKLKAEKLLYFKPRFKSDTFVIDLIRI